MGMTVYDVKRVTVCGKLPGSARMVGLQAEVRTSEFTLAWDKSKKYQMRSGNGEAVVQSGYDLSLVRGVVYEKKDGSALFMPILPMPKSHPNEIIKIKSELTDTDFDNFFNIRLSFSKDNIISKKT